MSDPSNQLFGAVAQDEATALVVSPSVTAEPVPAKPTWLDRLGRPELALPLLILLCAGLFFTNLGYPVYTKGEAREAVTVVDMFQGHSLRSFLLPMRAGIEIPSKPLLMHWLIAIAAALIGGINEVAVRLPSATLATLAVLCCYLYVRRLFDGLAGLFAGIVLGTTLQMLQAGSGARVDMTLTFFMELGFFEFLLVAEDLSARRIPLYLALALAVLAKGPVGLVLPAATAFVFLVMERRWSLLKRLDLIKGAILIAILDGGWYLAAIAIGGRAFIHKQILAENIDTYLYQPGVSGGHGHPFYYLELALLVGFLPWTVLLPLTVSRFARAENFRMPRVRYLVIWFAIVLLFYNFAYSKRGVYLLSLYPALAAATGLALAQACRDLKRPRWLPALTAIAAWFAIAAGVVGALCALLLRVYPAALSRPLAWGGIDVAAFNANLAARASTRLLTAFALAFILLAIGYQLRRFPAAVARLVIGIGITITTLAIAANLFVIPAIAQTLTLKPFALTAAGLIGDRSAIYLSVLDYDVAFYSQKTIPFDRHLPSPPPDYVITGADIFAAQSGGPLRDYTAVVRSNPTDFDNSGVLVLLRRNSAPPSSG